MPNAHRVLRVAAIHPPPARKSPESLTADQLWAIAENVNSGRQRPAVMISHLGTDELVAEAQQQVARGKFAPGSPDDQLLEYFRRCGETDWHTLARQLHDEGKIPAPSIGTVLEVLPPSDLEQGWWHAVVEITEPGACALVDDKRIGFCSMQSTTLDDPADSLFIELSLCAVPLREGCRFLSNSEVASTMPANTLPEDTRQWLSGLGDNSKHFETAARAALQAEYDQKLAAMEEKVKGLEGELAKRAAPDESEFADRFRGIAKKAVDQAWQELGAVEELEDGDSLRKTTAEMDMSALPAPVIDAFQKAFEGVRVQASRLNNELRMARAQLGEEDTGSRKRSRLNASGAGAAAVPGGKVANTGSLLQLLTGSVPSEAE